MNTAIGIAGRTVSGIIHINRGCSKAAIAMAIAAIRSRAAGGNARTPLEMLFTVSPKNDERHADRAMLPMPIINLAGRLDQNAERT